MQLRTFKLKPQYFQQNKNHTHCSPMKIGVLLPILHSGFLRT